MGVLTIIGATFMGIAAASLVALALDSTFRHGGEGFLIGIAYAATATLPGSICASMLGLSAHDLAVGIIAWSSLLCVLVAGFSLFLLAYREKEGIICLGIACVAAAAIYTIAPGYLNSTMETPAANPSASR